MKIRSLIALLGVLALGALLTGGTASAALPAPTKTAKPAITPERGCVVNSLPSFIAQGLETEASSVADIVEVECEHTGKKQYDGKIIISDTQLFTKCGKKMSWSPTNEFTTTVGPTTEAKLDDDGNATVVLWAGPECKTGETTIIVDEKEAPAETYMTTFTVLAPEKTKEAVLALDPGEKVATNKKVADDIFGSVATIIQVEFPVVETKVAIDAEQLLLRCKKAPHVIWIGANEKEIARETGRLEGPTALKTDDLGNAFVVALGAKSCQPGKVTIEASLELEEHASSVFTTFEIEFPRPTI